ncbi:unnamed protein product [Closterium sp. NIES-54]
MMENFFSFVSFYEQHQQAAPAQSNNIDNNNRVTPMSFDGSSYARGNQQQPTFAPYEPRHGSISFMPHQQPSPGQEKTLDALQVSYLAFVRVVPAFCAILAPSHAFLTLGSPQSVPLTLSAARGAGESALSGTAPTEALHTFTLDSGALRSFFRDTTMLTPLTRPVTVPLADPSGVTVLAHSSTVLPCLAALLGLLSGLHLPSFSTNLVSGADLQFAPGGQRMTHCTCSWTGRHLATFTRRPGSSLYTLTTAPPPVSASGQVASSSQVFAAASRSSPASAPCSCCPLTHETLLLHHRLGHPSLPRLRGMASRILVSGIPRCLPPLPPGPAPTFVPCVEGRQRAAPYSSSFPPTEAPLQTLHMDVWGPARVCGQGHERYFLLVVDDYSRYTSVFPLRSKGDVTEVLIDWIRGARRQPSESFGSDLPVLRLHSDKGGEFSSDLLRAFCRAEGIRQTFTLPASPQKNGIAERRIGMVMDVARTSMIHAATPPFLWPFAVQYAAHQINLQPRVSLPETTPTLRWTGKVGDVSAFRVWGSRAFFYHPTSHRVLSSQDVTFDESVSYYRLFPYRAASLPPPPLFLVPGTPPVDPFPPQDPAPSGVSQVDTAEPVEVAVDSGAATGAEPAGAGTGGAEPGVAEPERVEPRVADSGSVASWGAEPACAESRGSPGVPLQREPPSPQRLREWYARLCRRATRATGAGAAGPGRVRTGGTGAAGAGATRGAAGAGAAGGAAGAGATGGAAGAGAAGGASGAATRGATGAGAAGGGSGAVSAVSGGATRPRLYYVPLLQQCREPESRPVSPVSRAGSLVRTVRAGRVLRPCPPPVPGTHSMTLRPSTAPQHVPLPSPPASSLPDGTDPESDSFRAAGPTVTRFLATAVTDPLFESSVTSALVSELVDFATAYSLDYATSLVAESESASVCPPSVGGECALGTDVLEDRQEEFECFAAALPHLAAMDAEMASRKSTGTYVDAVPPFGANTVSGMWIFGVKRPSVSLTVFKARYFARGFTTLSLRRPVCGLRQSPREWHDTLRTTLATLGFAPSTADPSLFLRCYTTLPPFYVLVYVDDLVFATADTEALAYVKSELQKRHTCTDLGELTSYIGLRITRDRAQRTITLTQSHMVQQVLQCFSFTYSSPQSTPLPAGHSLSAPPLDESVEPSGPYPELVGCLMVLRYLCSTSGMGLVLGGRARVVLTGHADVSWELRWLTYLLTDLGESPRSPPVLYVDNKAMLALCQEHKLEHRTKHIALRYFLARELQQRGQLRLAYVASQANTADVFTKALQPCDHQRFCTVLGLVPTVPHLLTS